MNPKYQKLLELVNDLYSDFDRMSSSGQQTLEEIAKLLGIPTQEEINKMPD